MLYGFGLRSGGEEVRRLSGLSSVSIFRVVQGLDFVWSRTDLSYPDGIELKVAGNILKISLCLNVVLLVALVLGSGGADAENDDADLKSVQERHGELEGAVPDPIEARSPSDQERPSAVPASPDIWVHVPESSVRNIRLIEKGGAVSEGVLENLNLTESEIELLQGEVRVIYDQVVARQKGVVTKKSDDMYVIEGIPDEIEGYAEALRESFEKVTSPEIAAFLTEAAASGGFLAAIGKEKTITFEWEGPIGEQGSFEVMKVTGSSGYFNYFLESPRISAQNRELTAPFFEILGLSETNDDQEQ